MIGSRALAVAALVAVVAAATAGAQDPARLPEMVIKGLPGPGILAGVVRDNMKFTVEETEVFIPALQRRTVTRLDGSFRFDDMPRGKFEVRARKIGYRPQTLKVTIGNLGGVLDFELQRAPRALPAMVSSAERGGLSGVVGDTSFRTLEHAFVRVMGEGLTVYTDSTGSFFFPLKAGDYLVGISKPGFGDRLVSVTIPSDSGRRIMAFLQPTSAPQSKWVFIELSQRMAWRDHNMSRVYTREQLQKLGVEGVYQAARMMTAFFGWREQPHIHCMAIVDGVRTIELTKLTVDEIDSVEFYFGRECPITYVWMR